MQYIRDRGSFDDFPFADMVAAMHAAYGEIGPRPDAGALTHDEAFDRRGE
jgi:hypothetical protein